MTRDIELEGVTNARDLGGIPVEGGREVVPGLLFRGGELAGATSRDQEVLFDELGISCVVDVRCGWECEAKPDAIGSGVTRYHIPFYDLEKVGIEYTEPSAGTRQVGRDVACNPVHFYRSLANPLTVAQMREGMGTVFGHALQGCPVYVHCSGGKDRAGISALLMLTILGASRQDILDDYLRTNIARDKNYDKMLARFLRFADGDEALARQLTDAHRALPENVEAFYDAVDESYGSMDSFVRNQLGMSDARIAEIRERCTRECCTRELGTRELGTRECRTRELGARER